MPKSVQPDPSKLNFDLQEKTQSVVKIRSVIPEDAFTAQHLGTSREGNGVLVNKTGLVATIGYLIHEAEQVWLTSASGKVIPGHPVAYDFNSGFGFVQALGRFEEKPAELGTAKHLSVGSKLLIASSGEDAVLNSRLIARRDFPGYWEYYLEDALFCQPAHPMWGGAAVFDEDGSLVALGSLLVQMGDDEKADQNNMVVPIDLLKPLLRDLEQDGRLHSEPRPWIGVYAHETHGGVIVGGTASAAPAEEAGIEEGDLIVELNDFPIGDLADFYRQLWNSGEPGVKIQLTLLRQNKRVLVDVKTAARRDYLKKPRIH